MGNEVVLREVDDGVERSNEPFLKWFAFYLALVVWIFTLVLIGSLFLT